MNQTSKFSVRDICYAGLFAAVIAVMAQISIPMPLGVPMTMQTFAITLAAVVLGSKPVSYTHLLPAQQQDGQQRQDHLDGGGCHCAGGGHSDVLLCQEMCIRDRGYTGLRDLGGILSWPYEIEGDFEGHF